MRQVPSIVWLTILISTGFALTAQDSPSLSMLKPIQEFNEPTEASPKKRGVPLHIDNVSLVRLAVFEYLIEKEIKPAPGALLFFEADTNEIRELVQRFPAYRIKKESEAEITGRRGVRDKSTKEPGVIIEIKSISVTNQSANVYAGFLDGASVMYAYKLVEENSWRVNSVSGGIVADP